MAKRFAVFGLDFLPLRIPDYFMYDPRLTLFVGLAFRSYLAETVLFLVALVMPPDFIDYEVFDAFSAAMSCRRNFTGLEAAN